MSLQELSNSINKWRIIKDLFRDYYRKRPLKLPQDLELREIAIQIFGSSTYIRHKAFQTPDQLYKFIELKIPRHIYYSCAKYDNPAAPSMDEKGWLGSDLVFDIDADHIPGCSQVRIYVCRDCKYSSSYIIHRCPNCNSNNIDTIDLSFDETCIELAKDQVRLLTYALSTELGFSKFLVYFSGHRGFHIHVPLDGEMARLSSDERREIVDYLKGVGLNRDLILFSSKSKVKKATPALPRITDGGWRTRIAHVMLLRNIKRELEMYMRDMDILPSYKDMKEYLKYLNEVLEHSKIHLDEKVTIDTSRLIRIPGSLNGKAGLIVLEINDIESFELHQALSPFNELMMRIRYEISIPQVRILGVNIGPRHRGDYEILPGAIAIWLALKDVCVVLGISR